MNKNSVQKMFLMPLILVMLSLSIEAEEHGHEGWEVGISAGYANLKTENEEGKNLHLHLMHAFGNLGWFKDVSVGLGGETIVTDEEHYGLMLTLAFNPIEDLTLAIAPGFEWAKHDGVRWEREYATHFEATYSFDISEGYHVGPSVGYSSTKDAEHYTIGVHLGMAL